MHVFGQVVANGVTYTDNEVLSLLGKEVKEWYFPNGRSMLLVETFEGKEDIFSGMLALPAALLFIIKYNSKMNNHRCNNPTGLRKRAA